MANATEIRTETSTHLLGSQPPVYGLGSPLRILRLVGSFRAVGLRLRLVLLPGLCREASAVSCRRSCANAR